MSVEADIDDAVQLVRKTHEVMGKSASEFKEVSRGLLKNFESKLSRIEKSNGALATLYDRLSAEDRSHVILFLLHCGQTVTMFRSLVKSIIVKLLAQEVWLKVVSDEIPQQKKLELVNFLKQFSGNIKVQDEKQTKVQDIVTRLIPAMPEPILEPIQNSMPEPTPEPKSEPIQESIPKPVPEPKPEPIAETIPESQTEPIPASQTEPIPEPITPESKPEPIPEPIGNHSGKESIRVNVKKGMAALRNCDFQVTDATGKEVFKDGFSELRFGLERLRLLEDCDQRTEVLSEIPDEEIEKLYKFIELLADRAPYSKIAPNFLNNLASVDDRFRSRCELAFGKRWFYTGFDDKWSYGKISIAQGMGNLCFFDDDDGDEPLPLTLDPSNPLQFSMDLLGEQLTATLHTEGEDAGKLCWSDGDKWSRIDEVQIGNIKVEGIKDSAYRFGDLVRRSIVGSISYTLGFGDVVFKPYVKLTCNNVVRKSPQVETNNRCANFDDMLLRVPRYARLAEVPTSVNIEVYDARTLTASIRGDPLIGEAKLDLSEEFKGFQKVSAEKRISLMRDDKEKGVLILTLRLAP